MHANTQDLMPDASTGNNGPQEPNEPADAQKIAENPNPRANENIKQTPFEKSSEVNTKGDEATGIGAVGTEITDGEAG